MKNSTPVSPVRDARCKVSLRDYNLLHGQTFAYPTPYLLMVRFNAPYALTFLRIKSCRTMCIKIGLTEQAISAIWSSVFERIIKNA